MNFNQKMKNINPEKVKELETIITNKLNLLELLTEYGVDTGDGVRMTSPFGEDLAPSFFINQERQLWNDFSQGWGGGFVALYVKLNLVLKGRKIRYYDALEEILKRYPTVRQEFTGSLYTLDNISTMSAKTPEELLEHLNSRKTTITKTDITSNKWFQAEQLRRTGAKEDIISFCIKLQNSSVEWEKQSKLQERKQLHNSTGKQNAVDELKDLANNFNPKFVSNSSEELLNVSLDDLVVE